MSKTHFSALSSFILLSLYSTSVLAANDWTKPCFNGTCSYDLPDDPSGSSGTIKIWGSNTAIADITPAGGWEIIGCDPNKQEQDIKIVCKGIDMDGDGDNDGCSHLFAQGLGSSSSTNTITTRPVPTGTVVDPGNNSTSTDEDHRAIGKIVRLPEECGSQAFGRIANTWTHENQTVPSHISKRLAPLHRRTQHRHKVKGLTIDTQFHKSNIAQHGSVNFAIVGANVPGAKTSSTSTVPSLKTSGHSGKRSFVHSRVFSQRRGFGSIIHDVGDAIGDGAGAIGGAISDGAGTVGGIISDGAGAVGDAIGDGVGAIGDAISGTKSFNNSISHPLEISKTFTLLDQSIKCTDKFTLPGINGSTINPTITASGQMKVDVEAGIKGTVTIGVAASGSLTDLRVDSFEMSTKLDADLTGAIVMSAGVGGSVDSGKINFFELGIPGFDFPGIFSIGPTFQINGQAKVSLNVDTQMRVGMIYHIGELEFDFPDGGKKSGTFNPGDTPLQLSAVPTAKATGKVEAHLIPSLNVGINAFGGVAKAEIFANLDASASMTLTEDVTLPSVKANVTLREERPAVEIVRPVIRGRGAIGAYYLKKRSPAPEPSGLEDIVEAIEKASEAIVDGVKELKDLIENPNPSSSPIPAPTESSPADSPNAPPPATPAGTEGVPAASSNLPAPGTLAPIGSSPADSPNSPSPTSPAPAGGSSADPNNTPTHVTPAPTGSSPAHSPNSPSSAVPAPTGSGPAHSPNSSSSAKPTPTKSSPADSTNTPGPAIDLQDPNGSPISSSSAIPTATEGSTTDAPKSSSMSIETVAVPESSPTASPRPSAAATTTAAEGSPTVTPNTSSSAIQTAAGNSSAVPPSVAPTPAISSTATATGSSTSASPQPSDSLTVNDDFGFGGCLEFDAGLNANVGADADFFGLFNPSKTIPLFTKQYTLYKKCWGDKSKRRSMPDISSRHAALVGRDLQCNAGNSSSSGLQKLADEIVSALNIF